MMQPVPTLAATLERRPRLLLTLFCVLCWLPGFFTLPPGDRDESRFAQGTKQMIETGDYVRIMNGTEARNRKPIGIYWLQVPFVAAARAVGIADANPIWPYRVPSLLGGWVAVLATFAVGDRLFGRRAGLLAGAMLAGSVILAVETHIAKTDAALAGACAVMLAVFARAYGRVPVSAGQAALFWLAMAVGILLKGPIAPMIPALATMCLLVVDRRAGRAGGWWRALRPGWGVPLCVLAVLPWFVAIGAATGGRFFSEAIGGDLGRKVAGGDDAHGGPPGEHLLLLPLLLFPASLLLPDAARGAWRGRKEPAVRLLLAWLVPAWIVFELTPTKLPHYTLPLLPAVCLLCAAAVPALRGRWWARLLPGAGALVLALFAAALPIVTGAPPVLAAASVLAVLLVGVLAVRRPVAALVAAPLLYTAVVGAELPGDAPLWIGPQVAALHPPAPFGAVGYHEPSLMFSAGTDTRWMETAGAGADALASGRLASVLVADRDLPAFTQAAAQDGIVPRALGRVAGYNYSRGRRVVLTLFGR